MTTESNQKHYYRCEDCLTGVYATTHVGSAVCGICSGWLSFEGTLNKGRLVVQFEDAPCDMQCTTALGKTCDCKCGGKNHGTKMLVTFTFDRGKAPVAAAPEGDHSAALAKANEWRATLTEFYTAYEAKLGGRGAGEFLPRPIWDARRFGSETLHKARKLKSHAGRMKTARQAIACVAA